MLISGWDTFFFGSNDKTTPVASSKEYEAKMKEVGSRIDLHLYEGQEHSFFVKKEYLLITIKEMDLFLTLLGYIHGEPTIK